MEDSDENYDYDYGSSEDASENDLSDAEYSSLNEVETTRRKVRILYSWLRLLT